MHPTASERHSLAAANKSQAEHVAEQCGLGPEAATRLMRSIAGKGSEYQASFMLHSSDVAALLISHGVEPPALGDLLSKRYEVFTIISRQPRWRPGCRRC